jgi:ABC-type antimicrobial peptide transport system permease subunit
MVTLTILTSAIIGFCLGIPVGYALHKVTAKTELKVEPFVIVLSAVTFVFTVSILVDIASLEYETSPLLYGIMGTIVGFFFYRPKNEK